MADQEKLTALRCIDLLRDTERPEPRGAVRRHLKALINPRRRKAKRRG